jgi:type IV fimbrial biogenesis protein FimT
MNMYKQSPNQRHVTVRGFTLIELMVTIAILAILIGIAIPSFQEMIQSNRLQSASAEFQSTLAMARTEAIKRGGDAKVTVLANTVGTTTAWNNGYTVFVDRSAATTLAQLATESALAAANPTTPGSRGALGEQLMTIPALNSAINFTESNGYVTFNGMGRSLQMGGGGFLATTYQVTSSAGAPPSTSRCLMLNSMGRMHSERYSHADFAALTPANTCPATN